MAYAEDLKSSVERCAGSIPAEATKMRTHLDQLTEDFQRASVAYFAEAAPLAPGWKYVPHPYIHGEVMIQCGDGNDGSLYNRRHSGADNSSWAPREAYLRR